MRVFLDLHDRSIGSRAAKLIRKRGHEVHWTIVNGYEQHLSKKQQLNPERWKFDLAIVDSEHRRSPQTGSPRTALRDELHKEAMPCISCARREFDSEWHIRREGAYLWMPRHLLVQALRSGALDCAAALTWVPGSAARRRLEEEGPTITTGDENGWVVTEKGGHHPPWVSLARFLEVEYQNSLNPSQSKTVGWLAEDIPAPYYAQLAQLILQDKLGQTVKIETVEDRPDGTLVATYSRGRLPGGPLRFRRRDVTFEKVKASTSWGLSSLSWMWGRAYTPANSSSG